MQVQTKKMFGNAQSSEFILAYKVKGFGYEYFQLAARRRKSSPLLLDMVSLRNALQLLSWHTYKIVNHSLLEDNIREDVYFQLP